MISIILLITSNKSIDSVEAKSKRDKKPNIIFILSDDHTTCLLYTSDAADE